MSSFSPIFDRPRMPSIEWLIPAAVLLVVSAIVASSAGEMMTWYTIRATGILAYLLLTASVVARTALLAIVFSGVHGLALLLDTYIGFTPSQLLIPFISTYRPFGVGIGIISLYLTGGIYASFWARRFIGHRAWRALHFGSFLGFLMAAGHGIFSGSDSGNAWVLGLYGASMALVVGLTARRINTAKRGKVKVTSTQSAAVIETANSGQWA